MGKNIYTPVGDIYFPSRYPDIVFLRKNPISFRGYRLFHRKHFDIPIKYVPVGQTLVYYREGKVTEHLYFEGTPFCVSQGELVLYSKVRKGFGFVNKELQRSTQWPMNF